ncbi:MAG: restriction endonuclease subunit S [Bacteroidetes bacterium]|nr:restriction endonuclease subunit S [Bacteroidota bacterium]
MEKQKNIPQLRFPEFEGEWKRKKLGEIAEKKIYKNQDNSINNVFTNSASLGIVNQRDYFDKDIANQNNLLNYYVVEKDDFIYNPRISNYAPVGPISRNHIGLGVMSPLYLVFKLLKGNIDFFEKYFSTSFWHEYMESIANYGARADRMNITTGDFFAMPIPFPIFPEQTRIASFFTTIDKKIAGLKQKKILLEQYKKGVMQKLFSQELRFKDDTGKEFPKWEKKKLGEIANKIMYGMNAAAIPFDGENKYLRITDIDEKSRKFLPNPLSSPDCVIEEKYKLNEGDMIFARTGASVGKTYLYDIRDGNIYFAGFLIRFSITDANPYFIFFQTFLNSYNKWVQMMSMRSGQPGINAEEYKTFPVVIPCLAEQIKIANFLSAIDEKIDYTKKQIDKTEHWKKGLLQKMFC